MYEDQRRSPRYTLDVEVNYASRATAHTKDISSGGLCLITEQPMTVGKILSLSFSLPTHPDPVSCFGKVMWTRRADDAAHENGISFWNVAPATEQLITEFLSRESF